MDHGTVSLVFPSSWDPSRSEVALEHVKLVFRVSGSPLDAVHGMRVARTLRRLISGWGKSLGSLSVRSETPKATVEVSSRVTEEVETKNTPGDTDTQVHSGQSTGKNPKGGNNTSPSKTLHLAATKRHLLSLKRPQPAYAVDPLDVALTVGVSGMIVLGLAILLGVLCHARETRPTAPEYFQHASKGVSSSHSISTTSEWLILTRDAPSGVVDETSTPAREDRGRNIPI